MLRDENGTVLKSITVRYIMYKNALKVFNHLKLKIELQTSDVNYHSF